MKTVTTTIARPLLSVKDLFVSFGKSEVAAANVLRNVCLDIERGQMLGLVGESGSGKSVLVNSLLGLLPDNARLKGSVIYKGKDLLSFGNKEMTSIRGKVIALMLQNSMSALNPVIKVGNQIKETMQAHGMPWDKSQAAELIAQMGFKEPDKVINSYPHQLSGGMRQRIGIAIAIAANPDILIADEPTTALDVINEQKVMDILTALNMEKGTGIIIVSHNLKMVTKVCRQIAVMYGGSLVELADSGDVLNNPLHPYTKELLRCDEILDNKKGDVSFSDYKPIVLSDKKGCRYISRCALAIDKCGAEDPLLKQVAEKDERKVACFATG